MNQQQIIFIPGKNPKPPADQHQKLLWRILLEGLRCVDPEIVGKLGQHAENFKLIVWNYLYFCENKDMSSELVRIDVFPIIGSPLGMNYIQRRFDGIYNFYRNEKGLNCHRSYGYLVNPAVGKVIADWWQQSP